MRKKQYGRKIKTAALITVSVLLAAVLSGPVFAAEDGGIDDFDYSGPLDPVTNEIISDTETSENERSKLSDNMYYDPKTKDFVYILSGTEKEVHSSAADGMVLSEAVSVSVPSASDVVIYRDGSPYTGKTNSIRSAGEYVVSSQSGSDLSRLFSFTILGERTNGLTTFTVPDGFYITAAERDGNTVSFDRYSMRLDAEGAYQIEYACMYAEKTYTLETVIDRTPPTLEFSGKINSQNQVRSALEFKGVEAGGAVAVYRNGSAISVSSNSEGVYTLDDSGTYRILAYDAAGNSTEYNYQILMYFNISSILFVLFAGLLLIGVAVYVLIKRKSLKIG